MPLPIFRFHISDNFSSVFRHILQILALFSFHSIFPPYPCSNHIIHTYIPNHIIYTYISTFLPDLILLVIPLLHTHSVSIYLFYLFYFHIFRYTSYLFLVSSFFLHQTWSSSVIETDIAVRSERRIRRLTPTCAVGISGREWRVSLRPCLNHA